ATYFCARRSSPYDGYYE
nr:immunoglobulin heavy chain junction region [Mus musculus]